MSVGAAVPERQTWHRYSHLAVVYIVWGSTYLAVKICVSGPPALSPIQLQTWRMWFAGALLMGMSLLYGGFPTKIGMRDLLICGITGTLMWVFGNGLATLASRHAASGFIVMTMGIIPVWTTLIGSIMSRTVPSRAMLLGILIGIIGLGFVVVPPALSLGTSPVEAGYAGWAALILCLGGLTWSLGSILQRPLLGRLTPQASAALQMLSAAIVLTVIAKVHGDALVPTSPISLRQILAFAFLVVFGSAICLISYIKVIKSFSPAAASTFAYVNPLVGVALGWAFLGELPAMGALFGIVLILLGVFLVIVGPRRR
jgi:drug/metabolite transporter (DMT)-like permease